VRTRGRQDGELHVGSPLEEAAKVMTVGVESPPAIAGKERQSSELSVIDDEVVLLGLDGHAAGLDGCHGGTSSLWEVQRTARREPAIQDATRRNSRTRIADTWGFAGS
jgi:hypothetical protein